MIDPVHKKIVLHTGSSQITIDSQGVKVLRQSQETNAPQQSQNNSHHHSLMRAQQLHEIRHNYQNPSFVGSMQGTIKAQEGSYNKYNKTNNLDQFVSSNGISISGGANQANGSSLSQRFSQIIADKNKPTQTLPRQQHVEVVQNNECELQKASRNPAFSRSNPLEKTEKPSPQRELLSMARQIVRRAQEIQQPGFKEQLNAHQKNRQDIPNENTIQWINEEHQHENASTSTQEQLQNFYRNQASKLNNEFMQSHEKEINDDQSEESETEQHQEDNDDYDDCEDSDEYSDDCQSPNQIQIEEEEESQSEPEVNDQSDDENYINMNYPFMPALPEDLEFAQNLYNDPETTFNQEYEPNDESFDGTGGLTKAEFLSLPTIVYTSQPIRLKQSKYSTQQDCSICLSHYQDNEILCVLPCEHRFHRTCIDKWLKLNSKCVICKHDLIA